MSRHCRPTRDQAGISSCAPSEPPPQPALRAAGQSACRRSASEGRKRAEVAAVTHPPIMPAPRARPDSKSPALDPALQPRGMAAQHCEGKQQRDSTTWWEGPTMG
ncbi:hypothetical protein PVAP13_5KG455507 [Panicum virgatum]|uniref:Uncharacterized protein n=1 Tax=Panicum virgatum TaxID=38727 RepID=A0A8T0SQN2_PANVG|nr:hypothetical protein PVAP13_5KG455507 [Panicum virgatum]